MSKLISILFLAVTLTASSLAQTILFEDDFEGSIRSEWVNYANGFTVTTDQAQHGSYSVTTGAKDRYLQYDLTVPLQNVTVEGWFFDLPSANPYELSLDIYGDSASGIGIETSIDTSHYIFRLGYFDWRVSSIERTSGWHLAQIFVGDDRIDYLLDGSLLHRATGSHNVRLAYLLTNGASGQDPSAPYYFDNFRIYEGAPVPEPATIGLIGSALVLAARRRRR